MNTEPYCRLHLFFATENSQAVILRQGPSKTFRMILWDRDTDRFEDGQWLKHKVYAERCDISPDGRHFIYFALDGRWGSEAKGSYTAISRPPYFTALALFPQGDTWGGGGVFIDTTRYVADGDKDIIGQATGLSRLSRVEPSAECPSGLRTPKGACVRLSKAKALRAHQTTPGQHPDLSKYDTKGGKLWRRRGQELTLIRDFTDMAFEPITAPYDTRPRGSSEMAPMPWHPLDRDGS
ncbi:hypothetical protein EI983_02660 [Roseovarius faecimaris]|uniref:Uncharacterized protein n=1 Tax=Roseovarius faecimaris TaxID=2494550 RepID=A0A6I6IMC2_9RHOB|nr:hypothetical protein [Roseovarius faecimaris]QGX97234.1 hypothetical protein EI983_02660 [Roseovarius faecimaris]